VAVVPRSEDALDVTDCRGGGGRGTTRFGGTGLLTAFGAGFWGAGFVAGFGADCGAGFDTVAALGTGFGLTSLGGGGGGGELFFATGAAAAAGGGGGGGTGTGAGAAFLADGASFTGFFDSLVDDDEGYSMSENEIPSSSCSDGFAAERVNEPCPTNVVC
jgi:hypothetical protein